MKTGIGKLAIVLHAHMPFVRHPEYPRFLEEDWLFEGINESYLPLLRVFRKLKNDQIPFKLTLSLSPTLCAMLGDEVLQDRYIAYLDRLITLTQREYERNKNNPELLAIVKMYQEIFDQNKTDFIDRYGKNILKGLKDFEKEGCLELITTSATHCFLPLYSDSPNIVDTQVETAMSSHLYHFGKMCSGFWSPECGYYDGLEDILKENEIKYFFSSAHGTLLSQKKASYGNYAPLRLPNGVVVFGRDIDSTKSVWSDKEGYPGDPIYRDFYRDIAHDLPLDYLSPFLHDGKIRANSGLKYYRITGKSLGDKKFYDAQAASAKIKEHAKNFVYNRTRQLKNAGRKMEIDPVITAPFDAELFGHWWFEGPQWIEEVCRLFNDCNEIALTTPSEYLKLYGNAIEEGKPIYSSWGSNGFSEVWLDGKNDWIYPQIFDCIKKMEDLVIRFPTEQSLKKRILNQAARELLLALSSDWPFIMYTGTTVNYATKRVKEHLFNFNRIYGNLCRNEMDTEWITSLERKNNLFPFIDYLSFGLRKK